LKSWIRFGVANGDLQPIDQYRGIGLYYVGPIDRHDNDQIGIAVAQVRFSTPYRQMTPGQLPYETDYELSYSFQLNKAIMLQPDVQMISHPSGRPDIKNAFVALLRTQIDFMAF